MPDIFISKDRQQKETDKKIVRIKKLLQEDMPKSAVKKELAKKNKAPASKNKEELKQVLKKDSNKHVLSRIQSEIHDILKDKPKNGFLATFLGRPRDVRFETQDKEEKVLALLRQHWVVNVPWIFLSIVLLILLPFLKHFPLFDVLPKNYVPIVSLGYFLFLFYFITERLLKWFYNVYIITDERIIDVDFLSLLYKKISGTKIDRIQDVSYDMSGLTEAFFNYGSVLIQTAAEIPAFEFENVPKPQEVVSLLNQLVLEEELEKIEGKVR